MIHRLFKKYLKLYIEHDYFRDYFVQEILTYLLKFVYVSM